MEQDKKTHTVIEQVNLETGGLYDFDLQGGEVMRLRYTGNGKWADPTTGETLERAPEHQNYTPVAGDYWTENAVKLQTELVAAGIDLNAASNVIATNAGAWFAEMDANVKSSVIATMRNLVPPQAS